MDVKNKYPGASIDTIVCLAEMERKIDVCRIKRNLPLTQIIQDVAGAMGISVSDITKKTRKPRIVICRQIFYYIAIETTSIYSRREIGELFNQDRTTALHGHATVKRWLSVEDPFFMSKWSKYINQSKLPRATKD